MTFLAAAVMLAAAGSPANAENINLVVGYSPGGTTDTLARILGEGLSKRLGANVVVQDKPGATGQIGSLYVARSKPDGDTLQLAVQTTHAVAPSLYAHLAYDPVKDFTPISLVAVSPLVLVENPKFPPASVKELIAYAKAHPGDLNYATGGQGDGTFMAALLFDSMAKISPVAVPFAGEGPAVPQVLGGQLPYMFCSTPTVAAMIKNGSLRALAVTSKVRASNLPDVPTMAEAGLPGYEMVNWWGIFGPAKMPPDVVKKLNAAILDVLHDPQISAKLHNLGYELTGSSPEEFGQYVKSEEQKWAQVIKDTHTKQLQ
jgi:tripartite-type tricarboxylate transporter receptor subunit TctC